jgi:hypothetical protein
MEENRIDGVGFHAWSLALVAAFLFALGGVATWAQEFMVWIPQRAASICIVLGLACSLWALIQAARILFSGVALARRRHWSLLWTILLAAIPPLVFIAWVVWMQFSLAEKL